MTISPVVSGRRNDEAVVWADIGVGANTRASSHVTSVSGCGVVS